MKERTRRDWNLAASNMKKRLHELRHLHNLTLAYNADEEKAEDERKGMMKR